MNKKLQMFKKLGTKLGQSSVYFLKTAFGIKPVSGTKSELVQIVTDKVGIPCFSADKKHYFTDWETWKQLIQYDWTDKKRYLKDRYDCDNFAGSFQARMAEIYDLNTAGRLFCEIRDKTTNEKIAGHVAVLIVDKTGRVFLMESQNDAVLEITDPNQKLIIGSWKYICNYVRFN